MKMPIGWHKKCLKNRKDSLGREEIELLRIKGRVAQSREDALRYERQISKAVSLGKDGFDSERFGLPGNKK